MSLSEFAFNLFGLNVYVHPWINLSSKTWVSRNGSGWNIHSEGNLYSEPTNQHHTATVETHLTAIIMISIYRMAWSIS